VYTAESLYYNVFVFNAEVEVLVDKVLKKYATMISHNNILPAVGLVRQTTASILFSCRVETADYSFVLDMAV